MFGRLFIDADSYLPLKKQSASNPIDSNSSLHYKPDPWVMKLSLYFLEVKISKKARECSSSNLEKLPVLFFTIRFYNSTSDD